MKLIPCIEMLYKAEHPGFTDRFRAAQADGFDAVDMWLWRDKPMDAVADAVAETGVQVFSLCADPRASLVNPAEHAAVLAAVRDTVPVARRVNGQLKGAGAPARIILASGFAMPGVAEAEQRANIVAVLREAARIAADGGVELLLEPVHMVIGGHLMAVHQVRQGLDLVEAVDHPALRLLADVYHGAVSGETFAQAFADRTGLVAHVQVADFEGRHEPGTGALDWSGLLPLLRQRGYTGSIGLEYLPTLPIDQSLALTRRTLGL
ncbi:TIM barrel protein [Ideonella livida]|uniref:TIM barrel protein n=1 Tax=Ideonella livida TaxID=2707176 RepID=A0A7C9PID1_9BURK|nr:TIM barrel protein [Ideonella livida]NDY91874.1 TIM barrel protein [Ideonella livida]